MNYSKPNKFLFILIFGISILSCKQANRHSEQLPELEVISGENGSFAGYNLNKQGQYDITSYMDINGNIKISESVLPKTSEIIIIPKNSIATIKMINDLSWNGYYKEDQNKSNFQGVFLKNRIVQLDSYVIGQYEVTEQLYEVIINNNHVDSMKPKNKIDWFHACAFCNEFTKKVMNHNDCIYYSDEDCSIVYTMTDAENRNNVYIAYDKNRKKWLKRGYRLPTNAEWEFAARGGNPNKDYWKWAFSGVNSYGFINLCSPYQDSNCKYDSNGELDYDKNLVAFCVYKWDGSKIFDVGSRQPNKLNLFDMSGNLWEWCYDYFSEIEVSNQIDINPIGVEIGIGKSAYGGCYLCSANRCAISSRGSYYPFDDGDANGFRLARSLF